METPDAEQNQNLWKSAVKTLKLQKPHKINYRKQHIPDQALGMVLVHQEILEKIKNKEGEIN